MYQPVLLPTIVRARSHTHTYIHNLMSMHECPPYIHTNQLVLTGQLSHTFDGREKTSSHSVSSFCKSDIKINMT